VAHDRYTARTTRRIERAGGITPGIAVEIISAVTLVVVFIGALLMWLVDRDNFPDYGRALWWAAQTVTTVGYGDVVPQNTPGKIVAAIVMFSGIALITVVSGAVASGLVQTVRRKRGMDTERQILQEIEALHRRLDQLGAPPRDQGQ
jgi:voltage-gated potassium channel